MLELLIIKFAPYSEEMFYPWEQHPDTGRQLRTHLNGCRLCITAVSPIFGTTGQQTKLSLGCTEGRDLAERLLAEKANCKTWKT